MEILFFLLLALASGAFGVGWFVYHLKRGQFEDSEETKYQMFRDDE